MPRHGKHVRRVVYRDHRVAKVEQSVRYPAIAATEVEDGRPGRQCGVDDLRLTSRRQ